MSENSMTDAVAPTVERTEMGSASSEPPFYLPVGEEIQVFEAAWDAGLSIMLKGPTGCGKTRLVEHMAGRLGLPLFAVSCHEDIVAGDLLGRYLLVGGETVWTDGPLTRAVREGGICYLDEIVEARQDSVVAIHSLTDHRRELTLERLGGVNVPVAPGFGLVVSYNPGYQSVLKELKQSTRQRLVAIELGFLPPDIEEAVVAHEASVDYALARRLITFAQLVRRLDDATLKEMASTRTLIAAAKLVSRGIPIRTAVISAVTLPLTDDRNVAAGLIQMVESYLGSDV